MAWIARALLLAVVAVGCSQCDEEGSRVPFKRASDAPPAPTGEGQPSEPAFPIHGQSHPAGTTRIALQDHSLTVGEHAIRASLGLDLDQDADTDALLVLETPEGHLSLARALSDGRGLEAAEEVGALTKAGAQCVTDRVEVSQLARDFVLVSANPACNKSESEPFAAAPSAASPDEPPRPPEPDAPPNADDMQDVAIPSHWLWIARVEPSLSILESIHMRPAQPNEPTLEASLRAQDLDGDGHSDLVLGLDVKHTADPDAPPDQIQHTERLEIALFDRPSGLSRDGKEPEATWLRMADEAKALRRRQPDRAGAIAARVLTHHALVCGELGRARIELAGTRGLACGASLAAGRAQTVAIAVLARGGRLVEALRRYEALSPSIYRITDNDRERAEYALRERLETSIAWSLGPRVALGTAPAARRSAIAFLDEHRVLIRSRVPHAHDLESNESAPVGVDGGMVIMDPSKKLALSELRSQCDGVVAKIVLSSQVVAGVVTGTPLAETHLLQGLTDSCAIPDARVARQIEVIDWTPKGLLLAEDERLYLAPLDTEGLSTSDPIELGSSAALPSMSLPATLSETGRYRVVRAELGIVWIDRSSGATRLIAWPSSVSARASVDLAISPSGNRLALLDGGQLHVAKLDAVAGPKLNPSAPPEPMHEVEPP